MLFRSSIYRLLLLQLVDQCCKRLDFALAAHSGEIERIAVAQVDSIDYPKDDICSERVNVPNLTTVEHLTKKSPSKRKVDSKSSAACL